MLSLSFITGTEPDKWFRRFTDRTDHGGLRTVASDDALAQLLSGDVDVALVRLPDARVTDEMHVVRLYDEQPGIALPVDHTLTLLEQVGETDIVGELIHYQGSSDIPAIREHLGVVAAGVGVVIAPRPVLKLLSGKKIVHREYRNPTYPATTMVFPKSNCARLQRVPFAKSTSTPTRAWLSPLPFARCLPKSLQSSTPASTAVLLAT